MRISPRQLVKWVLTILLCLLAVAVLVYTFVVHPDDGRIDVPAGADVEPFASWYEVAGTLTTSRWTTASNTFNREFNSARDQFRRANAGATITRTPRFSGRRIYTSTGEYPGRLEAHDGWFVPEGDVFKVWPALDGEHEVRFAAYADNSAARLTLRYGGDKILDVVLAQPVDAPPERGFFYRQLGRFLWPDRSQEMRRWHHLKAVVSLKAEVPLEFSCSGARHGCAVSDVRALKKAAAPTRRNVLMFVVDTMRGDAVASAPTISALAREGTMFANALSPGNMTSPSTNALLACRKAASLGSVAFAYAVNRAERDRLYKDKKASFPHGFRRAGYATAMIGNVSVLSEIYGIGVDHGFDQQIAVEIDAYDTPLITREAVQWLQAHGDQPFFLYVHMHGPHAPYRAPWHDVRSTFPGWQGFDSYPSLLRWLYQSEINYTDRYLAQTLTALDRLGLKGNTDVVITADHGDMHTHHRFIGNEAGPDFAGAYFDHGATLLNDEVRVPMIFRGPGIKAGQVLDQFSSTLDIGPTLLNRAGLEVPDHCEGQTLTERLSGLPAPTGEPVRTIGSEAFQGRAIVMNGHYKYIRMYGPVDKRVYGAGAYRGPKHLYFRRHQLYDLRVDPDEAVDLSDSRPDLLAQAEAAYREFYAIDPMFELVVESPEEAEVTVIVPAGVEPLVTAGYVKQLKLPYALWYGPKVKRAVMELRGVMDQMPVVYVGAEVVPVAMTGMKLPLPVNPHELPLEPGGVQTLLPMQGDVPVAYLRRVQDDGQKDRRMSVGNPAFDKILREWGYLND